MAAEARRRRVLLWCPSVDHLLVDLAVATGKQFEQRYWDAAYDYALCGRCHRRIGHTPRPPIRTCYMSSRRRPDAT
ncbi:hypothetical protein ACTWPT_45190 [Nonomuraea sp. 3N208]|uniref:hypothetical protein n=1 Tax=Nonomuraea sp. 3N208 TaxID=3457421 RepID=UPI003FD186AE